MWMWNYVDVDVGGGGGGDVYSGPKSTKDAGRLQ